MSCGSPVVNEIECQTGGGRNNEPPSFTVIFRTFRSFVNLMAFVLRDVSE
jgi:hypothetical protein